jgi:hypothetical protein
VVLLNDFNQIVARANSSKAVDIVAETFVKVSCDDQFLSFA